MAQDRLEKAETRGLDSGINCCAAERVSRNQKVIKTSILAMATSVNQKVTALHEKHDEEHETMKPSMESPTEDGRTLCWRLQCQFVLPPGTLTLGALTHVPILMWRIGVDLIEPLNKKGYFKKQASLMA